MLRCSRFLDSWFRENYRYFPHFVIPACLCVAARRQAEEGIHDKSNTYGLPHPPQIPDPRQASNPGFAGITIGESFYKFINLGIRQVSINLAFFKI